MTANCGAEKPRFVPPQKDNLEKEEEKYLIICLGVVLFKDAPLSKNTEQQTN
jgi:hypothetical protein